MEEDVPTERSTGLSSPKPIPPDADERFRSMCSRFLSFRPKTKEKLTKNAS